MGSAQLWRDVPDRLARQTGCAALVYSRYGNGRAPVLREARTVNYMHEEARTLHRVLERLQINDAILIGHSDGASIALIAAGAGDRHIRACVLLAPHVFVEDHSLHGIAKARDLYESTDLHAKLARYHRDADATFYGWNRIWLDPAFYAWNIRPIVKNVRIPLFAIQGADDEYGTFAQIEALHAETQGPLEILHLANCGHSPQRDRTDDVLRAIGGYVGRITAV
ncbi:MAG: alpha/beta fold hydrolase, partial [Candidatus Baltobacteraceae bacterium]